MPNYVVAGSTGGIGSEVCRRLREEGHRVFLIARDPDKLQAQSQELDAAYCSADITSFEEAERAFGEAEAQLGEIHGAVSCVGGVLLKPLHLVRQPDWEEQLSLNLHSAFSLSRAAVKTMLGSGGGSIVLTTTAAAKIGLMNHEAVSASKAGIEGLVLSAAATYAPKGIRINAVAPGLTKTPLTEKITSNPAGEKASLAMHPLGRLGEASDIAQAIVWMLAPENDWLTGQIIAVDGGLSTLKVQRA